MNIKRFATYASLVFVFASLALYVAGRQTLGAGKIYTLPTDSLSYVIQNEGAGVAVVSVAPISNASDKKANYILSAKTRTVSLSQELKMTAEPESVSDIPIQITFVKPLDLNEAKAFVSDNSLLVESFALVLRTATNDRATAVYFGDLDTKTTAGEMRNSKGGVDTIPVGKVIVLKAKLQKPMRLEGIANDDRVFLADTSEHYVRGILNQKHSMEIAGKQIVVSVETPFWSLDW